MIVDERMDAAGISPPNLPACPATVTRPRVTALSQAYSQQPTTCAPFRKTGAPGSTLGECDRVMTVQC